MIYKNYRTALTGGAVAATLLIAQIAPCAAQNTRTITLDSGTVIPVKLRETLSSTDSRKGDRFTAILQSDDTYRSLDLPRGTHIEGMVSSVRAMQGKDPGVISLHFNRVVLPNESAFSIQGSLIGLDDKSVSHNENGRLVAKPDQKNKTIMYAGYGAGAGLLLGAITKGNTILDTLIGGGLGYLFGNMDKNHGDPKDITLKPGTEMGVRLDHSVQITTYTDNSYVEPPLRTQTDDNNGRGTYKNGEQIDRNHDQNGTDRNRDQNGIDRNHDQNGIDRNRDQNGIDRNRDQNGSDTQRDVYDNTTLGHQAVPDSDTYRVMSSFTDVRDNGQPVRVNVDGRPLAFMNSARPFIANGIVMVPAVPVLKAAHVRYSYTAGKFTADGPGESLTVTAGSRIATGSNTRKLTLPATVRRQNGTLYVPMQFLAVVTGERLRFDRDSQTMELGSSDDNSVPLPH